MAAKPWAALAWGFLAWTGEGLAQEGDTPRAGLGAPNATPIVENRNPVPTPGGGLGLPVNPSMPDPAMPISMPPDSMPPEPPVRPVAAQRPGIGDNDDILAYLIQLNPPGPQRLFRLESEEAWRERVRHEGKALRRRVEFPDPIQPMPLRPLPQRTWPNLLVLAEPCNVCYGRLWFQQRNFERYGWDLGMLTPGVSVGMFLVDGATLPLNWLRDPLRNFECSAGQCLPGDPRPLLLDPLRKQ